MLEVLVDIIGAFEIHHNQQTSYLLLGYIRDLVIRMNTETQIRHFISDFTFKCL